MYAGVILNRPVYLIQLKFLLSSNTVPRLCLINANCDSHVPQGGHTLANRTNALAADFGRGFTVRDHRRAHAHTGLCVFIAGALILGKFASNSE